MNDKLDEDQLALDSAFFKFDVNEAIVLYKGNFTINDDETSLNISGVIKIDFIPKPKLRFEGVLSDETNMRFDLEDIMEKDNLMINITGFLKTPILVTNISYGSTENKIHGILKKSKLVSRQAEVVNVSFSVVNFIDDFGRSIKKDNFYYRGRTILIYGDWEVIIDKRYDFSMKEKEIFKRLKTTAGFVITHVGCLRRRDGKVFNSNEVEVEHIISGIHWLLSFAAGRHVSVHTLEGYSKDMEKVWNRYQVPRTDGYNNNLTWFPRQKSYCLEEIFPKLMRIHEDPLWKKVLWETLSWYMETQTQSIIENKVVSIQVALETLAWLYLIVDKNSKISKRKYNEMSAADRLRELLKNFSIDLTIPEPLKDKGGPYRDGPHLLTAFRNSIVHPTRKPIIIDSSVKIKVLYLGIWYLEMVILGILDYDGYYVNRRKLPTWEGMYDIVPWTIKDNSPS